MRLQLLAHEVYLPKPKLAVDGPGGVQASFDFQGAFNTAEGKMLTVKLLNDLDGSSTYDKNNHPALYDWGLKGFKVTVKPLTTLSYSVATMTAQKKLADLEKGLRDVEESGVTVEQPVDLKNPQERNALFLDCLIKDLAVTHIVGWDGVLDENRGAPADPTPENIRKVMDVQGCRTLLPALPIMCFAGEAKSGSEAV